MIIYFLGMFIALLLLFYEYNNTPKDFRCDSSEGIAIICLGAMLSWVTVIILLLNRIFNK